VLVELVLPVVAVAPGEVVNSLPTANNATVEKTERDRIIVCFFMTMISKSNTSKAYG